MCVLWIIQVIPNELVLCLFPANCILIGVKTVRRSVERWREDKEHQQVQYGVPILDWLNRVLMDSAHWAVGGFLLAIPLLGILVAVLVLLGQRPDSMIKAWTETSDWSLSQQTAPPNVSYDQHYLCTVAAQGHSRVVKPLRRGIRHGHVVTVNVQAGH